MKIVLVTPVNAESAIGRSSCLVADAFVRAGHDVTVVAAEHAEFLSRPRHPFAAPILDWNAFELVVGLMEQADVIYYQIGNYFLFHQGCLHWLERVPGIVIFHDAYLVDLFRGWAWGEGKESQIREILYRLYGEETAEWFQANRDVENFYQQAYIRTPMTEWIAEKALAAVTHSDWPASRLLAACPGPVASLALPYGGSSVPLYTDMPVVRNSAFQLTSIGYVNPNRRIPQILEALAKCDIPKNKLCYTLAGPIEPSRRDMLEKLAEEKGIRLECTGYISDERMQAVIAASDVICSLRYPALETASASCIEAMLHGKAVIVTRTGFYAELPKDCVMQIDPDNEAEELICALNKLYADASLRRQIGLKARRFAEDTFSHAEPYVQGLVRVAKYVAACRPVVDAVKTLHGVLGKWGHPELMKSSFIVDRLNIFEQEALSQMEQPQ